MSPSPLYGGAISIPGQSTAQPEQPEAPDIQIQIPESIAAGEYANFFQVRFSPVEMVLDFGRLIPDLNEIRLVSRVLMHPAQGKLLVQTLEANITAYEQHFAPTAPLMNHPDEIGSIGFRTSEDLRRQGIPIPPPRRIILPSDPGKPDAGTSGTGVAKS